MGNMLIMSWADIETTIWPLAGMLDLAAGDGIDLVSSSAVITSGADCLALTLSTNTDPAEVQGRYSPAGSVLILSAAVTSSPASLAVGERVRVTIRAVTNQGRQDDRTVEIQIGDPVNTGQAVPMSSMYRELKIEIDLAAWLRPGETLTAAEVAADPAPIVIGGALEISGSSVMIPSITADPDWVDGEEGAIQIVATAAWAGSTRSITFITNTINTLKMETNYGN